MYIYHISTSFCIQFVDKIKRIMPAKFCIQNVYKSLSKCGIHFVYKDFLYNILYTFCIQNVLLKCEIHFVYINSNLLKAYIINFMYIYNLYTKFIQNVYK